MRRDEERYTVSTSHTKIRTIAFVLALVLAVGAFAFGFSQMGHKDPGYYEIEADAMEEATHYRNGFTLMYYFDGSSNEIKTEMNAVKELYGAALLRSYKLLDTENIYDGYVNLASLNASLGQECQVSEELFAILQDAWAKTQEGRGFNMFAGSLYAEWSSILSLDDISEFDPAEDLEMAVRIGTLAEKTNGLENFELWTDSDSCMVSLDISQEYMDFLAENEYSTTVLSMNLLEDAYRLELVRNALEEQGYYNGYLCTDSGLTLSLSGHDGGVYAIYGLNESEAVRFASVEAEANSACSFLRAFPLTENEVMYHVIPDGEGSRYYHPNFVTATGEFANVLSSSCAVRYDGDVVGCCYENLALFNLGSWEEIAAAASGAAVFACTFLSDSGNQVYTNDPTAVSGCEGIQVISFK